MNREFEDAFLLYLEHCSEQRHFVGHPLDDMSEYVDGDWYLHDESGLIAIVTEMGNVGCICAPNAKGGSNRDLQSITELVVR